MMEEGQTFRLYQAGQAPLLQKLFYRRPPPPHDQSPGVLYCCDVRQRPLDVDVSGLAGLDLLELSDIFLGTQDQAFRMADGAVSAPDEDDGVSFSLVTPNDQSLHLSALSPQQRAAWILAIMGILRAAEIGAEGEDEQLEQMGEAQ